MVVSPTCISVELVPLRVQVKIVIPYAGQRNLAQCRLPLCVLWDILGTWQPRPVNPQFLHLVDQRRAF